jgi:hypothetical protein
MKALENLTVSQLVKIFKKIYGTRMFVTVFTAAHHWTLSLARLMQSGPHIKKVKPSL